MLSQEYNLLKPGNNLYFTGRDIHLKRPQNKQNINRISFANFLYKNKKKPYEHSTNDNRRIEIFLNGNAETVLNVQGEDLTIKANEENKILSFTTKEKDLKKICDLANEKIKNFLGNTTSETLEGNDLGIYYQNFGNQWWEYIGYWLFNGLVKQTGSSNKNARRPNQMTWYTNTIINSPYGTWTQSDSDSFSANFRYDGRGGNNQSVHYFGNHQNIYFSYGGSGTVMPEYTKTMTESDPVIFAKFYPSLANPFGMFYLDPSDNRNDYFMFSCGGLFLYREIYGGHTLETHELNLNDSTISNQIVILGFGISENVLYADLLICSLNDLTKGKRKLYKSSDFQNMELIAESDYINEIDDMTKRISLGGNILYFKKYSYEGYDYFHFVGSECLKVSNGSIVSVISTKAFYQNITENNYLLYEFKNKSNKKGFKVIEWNTEPKAYENNIIDDLDFDFKPFDYLTAPPVAYQYNKIEKGNRDTGIKLNSFGFFLSSSQSFNVLSSKTLELGNKLNFSGPANSFNFFSTDGINIKNSNINFSDGSYLSFVLKVSDSENIITHTINYNKKLGHCLQNSDNKFIRVSITEDIPENETLKFFCYQFPNLDSCVFIGNSICSVDYKNMFVSNETNELVCSVGLTYNEIIEKYDELKICINWE